MNNDNDPMKMDVVNFCIVFQYQCRNVEDSDEEDEDKDTNRMFDFD